jgi:hypothetical protein
MQGVIKHSTDAQKQIVADAFKGKVAEIAQDKHGAHVVQRFDQFSDELRKELNGELVNDPQAMRECAKSKFGAYVAQSFLEVGTNEEKAAVMSLLKTNPVEMATCDYGHFVFLKALKVRVLVHTYIHTYIHILNPYIHILKTLALVFLFGISSGLGCVFNGPLPAAMWTLLAPGYRSRVSTYGVATWQLRGHYFAYIHVYIHTYL